MHALAQHVKEYSNAYLHEGAKVFAFSLETIFYVLKRLIVRQRP